MSVNIHDQRDYWQSRATTAESLALAADAEARELRGIVWKAKSEVLAIGEAAESLFGDLIIA